MCFNARCMLQFNDGVAVLQDDLSLGFRALVRSVVGVGWVGFVLLATLNINPINLSLSLDSLKLSLSYKVL